MQSQDSGKKKNLAKFERLPKCYKDAEKTIKAVKMCQSNFKTVMANSRLRGGQFKKVYNLSLNVLKHYDYIQSILEHLGIPQKEEKLRKEIAAVLVYELLFGKGVLPGASKAVLSIQSYQEQICKVHHEFQTSGVQDRKLKVLNIPRYARIHTLVTTVSYVIKDLQNYGFYQLEYPDDISAEKYLDLIAKLERKSFVVDLHFKDLLVFAYNENLINSELYKKGHIFLQDKSSCIPVHALNPEPGSAVLDACAAPGMKSLHIAAKMKNKGLIIACERDKKRFETLKEMIDCGSVKISKMLCKDFRSIDPNDQAYSSVDYILLDPSCSGSGMVSRMDEATDTTDSKTQDRLKKLAGFQIIMLKHALKFPSVKRVVYSTCSVHEQENEYVIQEALNAFCNEFKLVPVMPEWPERGLETYEFGKLCVRTVPEKHLTNGFFVAAFERLDDGEKTASSTLGARKTLASKDINLKGKKREHKDTSESFIECLDGYKNMSFPPEGVGAENTSFANDTAERKKKRKKGPELTTKDADVEDSSYKNFGGRETNRNSAMSPQDCDNPNKSSSKYLKAKDADFLALADNHSAETPSPLDEDCMSEVSSSRLRHTKKKHKNKDRDIELKEVPETLSSHQLSSKSRECKNARTEILAEDNTSECFQEVSKSSRKKHKKKHRLDDTTNIEHERGENENFEMEDVNPESLSKNIKEKHKKKHKCNDDILLDNKKAGAFQPEENISSKHVVENVKSSGKKRKKDKHSKSFETDDAHEEHSLEIVNAGKKHKKKRNKESI